MQLHILRRTFGPRVFSEFTFRTFTVSSKFTMPSSKGKPTDPKLREKVKEEVKQKPNKDGSGKGQMAAWKVCNRATHATNIHVRILTRIGGRDLEGV